jgi:serine/threonine-protein kinase
MMSATSTIAGRYRIERRLGVGGMSTVHLAFDQRLERYVAIKLLAEHLADDATFVSRFRREALSAARLVHPNIVQVFDFGLDESSHQQFIVMEHVDGHSWPSCSGTAAIWTWIKPWRSSPRPAAASTTRTVTVSCIGT